MTLTVSRRLGLIVATALSGILILVLTTVGSERSLLIEERKLGVQQAVQSAHGIWRRAVQMAGGTLVLVALLALLALVSVLLSPGVLRQLGGESAIAVA